MSAAKESCPTCGALPCDWVQDPHQRADTMALALADIRILLGVNEGPMLSDLVAVITSAVNRRIVEAADLMRDACAEGWGSDPWDAEDICFAIEENDSVKIVSGLLLRAPA